MANDSKRGLLFVLSGPKPSSNLSLDAFHSWYDKHMRDIVDMPGPQGAPCGLRLKIKASNHGQDTSSMPFVVVYPLRDVDFISTQRFPANRPLGEEYYDIDFHARVYTELQRFQPGDGERATPPGKRGVTFVMAAMTPGEGPEAEADFDDWYRKQHLDMLSMCRGYLRTTRYVLSEEHSRVLGLFGDEKVPKYLAIHEYETEELPAEQVKVVVSTEWSKKILAESRFDRDVGGLIYEYTGPNLDVAKLQW